MENKPASLLGVPLGKAHCGIPPQMAGSSKASSYSAFDRVFMVREYKQLNTKNAVNPKNSDGGFVLKNIFYVSEELIFLVLST